MSNNPLNVSRIFGFPAFSSILLPGFIRSEGVLLWSPVESGFHKIRLLAFSNINIILCLFFSPGFMGVGDGY